MGDEIRPKREHEKAEASEVVVQEPLLPMVKVRWFLMAHPISLMAFLFACTGILFIVAHYLHIVYLLLIPFELLSLLLGVNVVGFLDLFFYTRLYLNGCLTIVGTFPSLGDFPSFL